MSKLDERKEPEGERSRGTEVEEAGGRRRDVRRGDGHSFVWSQAREANAEAGVATTEASDRR